MSDLAHTKFLQELTDLINRNSRENRSNTPDFILAQYMGDCLRAYEMALEKRRAWHEGDPDQ